MLLAALVPLAEKLTGAGGLPVVTQVYVRLPSPASSAPRTLKLDAVPVTGLGFAVAAPAIVGAWFGGGGGGVVPVRISMPLAFALSATVVY